MKKEQTSIKIDQDVMDKIEKFLELPDSDSKYKAEFARKAVLKEIEEIEKKHAFEEDHSLFLNELKKHEVKIKQLEKDLSYFKKEYAHEEKYEKHGKLEKALVKARIEDPEFLDDQRDSFDRKYEKFRKKKFLEEGYTLQEWKEFEKEKNEMIKKYKEKEGLKKKKN